MKKLTGIIDRYNSDKHLPVAQRKSFTDFLEGIKLNSKSKVLSISTGDGIWDYIILSRYKNITTLIATDIVDNPVKKADIKLLKSLGNWKFEKIKPETALPFRSNEFDLVYHFDVIEHVEKPYMFLQEQYRILKHGGSIILNTPNILRPTNILKMFIGKLYFPYNIGKFEKIGDYIHIQEFTEWTLIQMLKEVGFQNIKVTPVFFGIFPLNIKISLLPKTGIGRILCHCFTIIAEK